LRGQPLPRVFIVYEHKLFKDILANVLGQESIVGAAERVAGPFEATIEAIRSIGPDVVILEVEADGNNAWRILLASGEARRVVVLDMDKGRNANLGYPHDRGAVGPHRNNVGAARNRPWPAFPLQVGALPSLVALATGLTPL